MRHSKFFGWAVSCLLVSSIFGGCGDDSSSEPSNHAPVITSLAATPPVVEPVDTVALVCAAEDGDPDALSYTWEAGAGTIAGTGDSVTWTAPEAEGVYEVRVTVDDGNGGIARDTVSVDVFGGTLLLRTRDGVIAVRLDGGHFVFAPSTAPVEVLGTRIFVKGSHSITELDHSGLSLGEITSSNDEIAGLDFVILPGAGFVFLDNNLDVMHFVGGDGTFQETVAMPDPTPESLQNVSGIVVGNTLIVSETGTTKLIGVDLSTLEASIYRPFNQDLGWLGAIDYADGDYHVCRSQLIQRFTEGGPVENVGSVPAGNITGVVAVGSYLYVVVNHEGTLRRVHAETGAVELFVGELDYPQDIEYIPIGLTP